MYEGGHRLIERGIQLCVTLSRVARVAIGSVLLTIAVCGGFHLMVC